MPNKRSKSSKTFKTAAALAALAALSVPASAAPSIKNAVVREAVTGDTVRLEGGMMFRYAAIEAPPLQSQVPLLRQYGEQALAYNKALVEGKKIKIVWDSQIRNEKNDLVGYAFLEDGRFVNEELAKNGHAKARPIPPNLKFAARLRRAELDARRGRLGLWEKEAKNPFLSGEYVGDQTSKTFYFPTSPELEDIPAARLVPFRSRVEAVAAGYRPCPACREDRSGGF